MVRGESSEREKNAYQELQGIRLDHRAEYKTAGRIPVEAFRRELDRRGALHDAISRYSQGMIALMMQW